MIYEHNFLVRTKESIVAQLESGGVKPNLQKFDLYTEEWGGGKSVKAELRK